MSSLLNTISYKDMKWWARLFLFIITILLWLALSSQILRLEFRNIIMSKEYMPKDNVFVLKMAAYKAQIKTPDEVFIGSSRIARQVDTLTIKHALANMNCRSASVFNLGVGGGASSNTLFLLEWLLSQQETPKRIWVEPRGADQFQTADSDRSVFFSPVWPMPIYIARYRRKTNNKLRDIYNIIVYSLDAYLNIGFSHRIRKYKSVVTKKIARLNNYQEIGVYGYRSLDSLLEENDPRRIEVKNIIDKDPGYFKRNLSIWFERFNKHKTKYKEKLIINDIGPMLGDIPKKYLSHIGIIYPPKLQYSQIQIHYINYRGVRIPILTAPINENPFLGEAVNWMDKGHLNKNGAAKYSEYLAKGLCNYGDAEQLRGLP